MDRGSFVEAVAQLETGLEQLQKLPDDDRRAELELDLRNAAFLALFAVKGFGSPEIVQSTERSLQLCQRSGIDWKKTWRALREVFLIQWLRPDVPKACELAGELVALAEERGDAVYIEGAIFFLGLVRLYEGEFEIAAQAFDRGWALWNPW